MDALKKLQDVTPSKPYLGFAKLSIGYHQIQCFRSVKNKFGKKADGNKRSILIELDDQVLFLPQHFSQKITENDIVELNDGIDSAPLYLYFGGTEENSK